MFKKLGLLLGFVMMLFLINSMPSAEAATTIMLQNNVTDVLDDTLLDSIHPKMERGTTGTFNVFANATGNYTAIYKFNISSIPASMAIDNATLSLYMYSEAIDTGEEYHIDLHFVEPFPTFNISDVHWQEGDGDGSNSTAPEISWETRPVAGEYNTTYEDRWTVTGADPTPDAPSWITFSARNMVTKAYDNGDENVTMWLIVVYSSGSPTSSDAIAFESKENVDTTVRPYLNITYSESNTAPTTGTPVIYPTTVYTDDTLNCEVTITDPDADTLTAYYTWYKDDAVDSAGSEEVENNTAENVSTVASGDTAVGEVWICSITPYDGTENGTAANSTSETVQNTLPTASTPTIYPSTAYTITDLDCEVNVSDLDADTLTAYFTWYKDNDIDSVGSESPVTNNTLTNVSTLDSGDTASGETWICSIIPHDGTANGTAANSTGRDITNTIPVISATAIAPASPVTTDNLLANTTCYDIDDADSITAYYTWYVDNVANTTGSTSVTNDTNTLVSTLNSGNTTKSEDWLFGIICGDGTGNSSATNSSSKTIGNTAPVLSAKDLTPASPVTTDDLLVNATCYDIDGADSLTCYYLLYVDSATNETGSGSVTNDTNTQIGTLKSGNTSSGDSWLAEVWCGDATVNTSKSNSSARNVGNTVPVATSLDITPATVYTNNDMFGDATVYDVDADTLTAYYFWYKDNVLDTTGYNSTTLSNNTDTAINDLDSSRTAVGEVWIFGIIPYDGTANGTAVNASSETIQNTAPVTAMANITPSTPVDVNNLVGNTTIYDLDADTLTSYYFWYKDNVLNETGYNSTGLTNDTTRIINTFNNTKTSLGEVWILGIISYDGTVNGSAVNSSSVTVEDINLSISSPTNTTYSASDIWFNVTLAKTGSYCGVNYGYGNNTMTNSSDNYNFQNATMSDGVYTTNFYCNDSSNNWDTDLVTFTVDTTPPWYENLNDPNIVYVGDSTSFSVQWFDALSNLGSYIFSSNLTGTWVNDSSLAFSGTNSSWSNVSKTILVAWLDTHTQWRVFANDTQNNWNGTTAQWLHIKPQVAGAGSGGGSSPPPPAVIADPIWFITPSELRNALNIDYFDKNLSVRTNKDVMLNVSIVCSEDYSCEWARLVLNGALHESIIIVARDTNTTKIQVLVTLVGEIENKQYKFFIVATDSYGNEERIPYYLDIKYEFNMLDNFMIMVDDFANSEILSIPNAQFGSIYGEHVIILVIALLTVGGLAMVYSKRDSIHLRERFGRARYNE